MPTPDEIQHAHQLAARIRGIARVKIIHDPHHASRTQELIDMTIATVATGGSYPRRAKRGTGAWLDGHTVGSRAGRDFYVFAVGVGAVVCLASAAAFAAIGWWALLPALPIGLATFFTGKLLSSKWTKASALAKIRKIHEPGGSADANLEDGLLAEYMLVVLIQEYQRLLGKKDKYFTDDDPTGTNPLTRAQKWANAAAWGFDETRDVDVGRTISGRRNMRGGLVGSRDENAAALKVAILIRRNLIMIRFLKSYLEQLSNKVRDEIDPYVGQVDDVITHAVKDTIGVGAHHMRCPDDCCFGPSEENLTFEDAPPPAAPGASATPLQRRVHRIAMRNHINGHLQTARDEVDDVDFTEDVQTMVSRLRSASPVSAAATGAAVDLGEDAGVEERVRENIGNFDEYGGVDVIQGQVFSAATEGMESWLSEGVQAAAGGTGADLAMGPVGWVAGIVVGEIIQSVTVNRPTARAVGRIRAAAATSDGLKQELRKELGTTNTDLLERALSKVHTHYLSRLASRLKKIESDAQIIGLRQQDGSARHVRMTCHDAVRMVRYVYKAWRYVMKAEANIAYVRSAVDNLESHMRSHFPTS